MKALFVLIFVFSTFNVRADENYERAVRAVRSTNLFRPVERLALNEVRLAVGNEILEKAAIISPFVSDQFTFKKGDYRIELSPFSQRLKLRYEKKF